MSVTRGSSRQTTSHSQKSSKAPTTPSNQPATPGNKFERELEEIRQLPAEVIAEYREAFSLFDEDGDENITVNELAHVFRSLGQNPNDDSIQEMIEDVDADGDGTVSFDEFLVMMVKSTKMADSDKDLKQAYKTFCAFSDCSDYGLDWHGLKAIMAELGDKITDEEAVQMVRLADRDHDGYLSSDEFVRFLKSL